LTITLLYNNLILGQFSVGFEGEIIGDLYSEVMNCQGDEMSGDELSSNRVVAPASQISDR